MMRIIWQGDVTKVALSIFRICIGWVGLCNRTEPTCCWPKSSAMGRAKDEDHHYTPVKVFYNVNRWELQRYFVLLCDFLVIYHLNGLSVSVEHSGRHPFCEFATIGWYVETMKCHRVVSSLLLAPFTRWELFHFATWFWWMYYARHVWRFARILLKPLVRLLCT